MKKTLLSLLLAAVGVTSVSAKELQTISLNGKDYAVEELISRQHGPGIQYKRLRIPDYPLNVNMITVDLSNPYNRVETMQASETLYKTESLAGASVRYTTDEKRVIGGANGNFWCVSTQEPYSDLLIGATYNGNLRNGQIITETNAYSDQWDGGPQRTGVIAIDIDKKLYVESMNYKGYAKNEKIGSPEIIQVNKVVRDNEIAMYNSYYGKTKTFMPVDQYKGDDGKQHFKVVSGVATEVYLTVNAGQSWMAGRDMVCTVQEVKTDAGTGSLGSYDLCLVGRGTNKTLLAQLAAGDQVTINYGWSTADGLKTPQIEQLIGGNAIVMQNGELTGRNYDETYNSQVYSRTGYGASADGKTLYIIVIDKSTDPIYGVSAGCGTNVMCEIARFYGCDDMVTMDAGGSAQMLLDGKVINKTTESTPRSVANGWFVYSVSPADETIARIEFAEQSMVAPTYSTFTPSVLGYNQYGDLITQDLQGFTLSCDATLGSCNGMAFTAGGDEMSGTLTATYNGVSCTAKMSVVAAEMSIRIKPMLLIDAVREYPMEVTATIDDVEYVYDPAAIAWTVDDAGIAAIDENGVLRGLKEGTTRVIGEIGEFSDTTYVTVEIASAQELTPTDFTGWTAKGPSGITGVAMDEDGVISFTYGSPRGTNAYVEVVKDVRYYSIPDKLKMTFNSSIPVNTIYVDLRGAQYKPASLLAVSPSDGTYYEAGTDYEVEFPISHLGDPDDLIYYPVSAQSIRFAFKSQTSNKGAQTVTVKKLVAEYEHASGIENVLADNEADVVIYPNPVTDGVFTVSSSSPIKKVEIYSVAGVNVASIECSGENAATISIGDLAPGVYLVKTMGEYSGKTLRLIVK